MIVASCGHQVPDLDDLVPIAYGDEVIDHDDGGYIRCIVYKDVCSECAEFYTTNYFLTRTPAEEMLWLSGEIEMVGASARK